LIPQRCQGAGQALWRPRGVLASDQVGEIGELRGPSKFLQNAPQTHEAKDVDGGRQRPKVGKPAQDVRIAA